MWNERFESLRELEWTFKPVIVRYFAQNQNDVCFRDICAGPEGEGKNLFTVKENQLVTICILSKSKNHRKPRKNNV